SSLHPPPLLFLAILYFNARQPPSSTLFPYTTLFRSGSDSGHLDPLPRVVENGGHVDRDRIFRSFDQVSFPFPGTNHTDARIHLQDRKSTRLNSSHVKISYAVFCLKKKRNK